jgi:hypothetical protein
VSKISFIISVFAITLLVIFFYPKNSQIDDGSFSAEAKNLTEIKNMHCKCIGFEKEEPGITKSSTFVMLCYGIPINCEFICRENVDNSWKDVSCNELSVK